MLSLIICKFIKQKPFETHTFRIMHVQGLVGKSATSSVLARQNFTSTETLTIFLLSQITFHNINILTNSLFQKKKMIRN